jgi:hypothetical protein
MYATAGMITAFLIFSGVGSSLSGSIGLPSRLRITLAVAGIGVFVTVYVLSLRESLTALSTLGVFPRIAAAVLVVSPVAFLMGWPFPTGLNSLHRGKRELVPWAWGANGFASVVASPLAVLLSIKFGYTGVLVAAVALYVGAACVALGLPGIDSGSN